jgi:hypothetical protein
MLIDAFIPDHDGALGGCRRLAPEGKSKKRKTDQS